jgi:hypothetical protein
MRIGRLHLWQFVRLPEDSEPLGGYDSASRFFVRLYCRAIVFTLAELLKTGFSLRRGLDYNAWIHWAACRPMRWENGFLAEFHRKTLAELTMPTELINFRIVGYAEVTRVTPVCPGLWNM